MALTAVWFSVDHRYWKRLVGPMNDMRREVVELIIVLNRSQSFRENAGGVCMAKQSETIQSVRFLSSSGNALNFSFNICKRPDTEDPDRSRPVG